MAVAISGTTGIDLVQAASITQSKLAANVAGTGPCFSFYQSVAQSIPSVTFTKISLQTKEFDTASAFSSGTVVTNTDTTNRFTPQVAGYYQISGKVSFYAATGQVTASIYKNGVEFKRGADLQGATVYGYTIACLVLLNGSTDYVELFAFQGSGSANNTGAQVQLTYFQGFLARSA